MYVDRVTIIAWVQSPNKDNSRPIACTRLYLRLPPPRRLTPASSQEVRVPPCFFASRKIDIANSPLATYTFACHRWLEWSKMGSLMKFEGEIRSGGWKWVRSYLSGGIDTFWVGATRTFVIMRLNRRYLSFLLQNYSKSDKKLDYFTSRMKNHFKKFHFFSWFHWLYYSSDVCEKHKSAQNAFTQTHIKYSKYLVFIIFMIFSVNVFHFFLFFFFFLFSFPFIRYEFV